MNLLNVKGQSMTHKDGDKAAFEKLAISMYKDAQIIRGKGQVYVGDVDYHDDAAVLRMCHYMKEELLAELTPEQMIEKIRHSKFMCDCGRILLKKQNKR